VIREGLAFWVETRPNGQAMATRQAFAEGCFLNVLCYDASGQLWPVAEANLTAPQGLWTRLRPWRRVLVQLRFGTPRETPVSEVVLRLASILREDNEFCEHLSCAPSQLLEKFQRAESPGDLIAMAGNETSAA
jgi:hypothetical protein